MSKQVITRLLLIPIVGVLMIAVPTVSQAVTITSVTVTAGGTTYCDTTVAVCTNKIWNLGAGGTTLTAGGNTNLILTQAQLAQAFNFDVSDLSGSSGITATITIVTNLGTAMFTDTAKILTTPNGVDPGGQHQEAVDWTLTGSNATTGITLSLGYADNAHTGIASDPKGTACADGDGDCLPGNGTAASPWSGTANTVFLGSSVTSSACSRAGIGSCFDSGALLIQLTPTPEPSPSVLLLLGTALLGMFFVIQKQYKVKKGLRS